MLSAKTKSRNAARIVEQLADYLLGEKPSAAGLDRFGRKLNLTDTAFAALLGISPRTLRSWRRAGAVPEAAAERAHTALLKRVTGGKTGSGLSRQAAPGNGPETLEFDGCTRAFEAPPGSAVEALTALPDSWVSTRQLHGNTCRLGPRRAPCAKCQAISTALRRVTTATVRSAHAPQPGDGYEACECSLCRDSAREAPDALAEPRPTSTAAVLALHRTVSRWCACSVCSADRLHGIAASC